MKHSIYILVVVMLAGSALIGCYQKPDVDDQPAAKQDEQEIPRGKVTRYGLFHGLDQGWVDSSPHTSTGKIIRGSKVEFAETASHIPLRKGLYFGYRYWLKLPPDEHRPKLKRVLIHPVMSLPDGSKAARSERYITKKATYGIVSSLDVYTLSDDYELVEGEWVFQLWYKEHKLVEQKFIAYRPG